MFEKGLKLNESAKYELEEYLHNFIFPMKSTSDDLDYDDHNLWLIDEKLSYHYYIASDTRLRDMKHIESESDSRPDILVIDKPITVVNTEKPYNSIVIFEFKKPGRKSYDKSPIDQLYGYVVDIKNKKIKDKSGRDIIDGNYTPPFYLYLICDMCDKINEFAMNNGMMQTPDGLGYYTYNSQRNSYLEIISYEKLLKDSIQRNKILFDKLFHSL